ncbi:MAG TPA: hypothetical protein VII38_22685 [Polyangia bacterium]
MSPNRPATAALSLALALGALGWARPARACASCGCGDMTLTATGVERPYQNRVRAAVEERYGSLTLGDASYVQHIDFLRSTLAASWSPVDRLTLSALLPWVTSWVAPVGQPRETVNGLGDLELAARVVVFRERHFAPHHLLWLMAGLKFPTGPRAYDAAGYPFPDDDQPGTGSFDPFFGITYAWFSTDILSLYSSATYRLTTTGPRGYRRGSSLGVSSGLQVQPWTWGALVLGADVTWTAPDTLSSGGDSPSTGGTVVYLAPGLLWSPVTDLLVRVNVDVPVVRVLDGTQDVGPQVMLSVAYDIH